MKVQSNPSLPVQETSSYSSIPLRQLVKQLSLGALPLAVSKKSFILNDIDQGITINSDEDTLAYVLWSLLIGVVNHTENGCIRVEASMSGGCVLIYLKNHCNNFYSTASQNYRQLQHAAEKLGGSITIDNNQKNETVLSLSIACTLKAA